MPKVRNISDDRRFIPSIQREVDVDEAFDVPDDVFAAQEWDIPGVFEVITATTKESE